MVSKKSSTPQTLTAFFMTLVLLPCVNTLSFNYPSFESTKMILMGDATISSRGLIDLTINQADALLKDSVGRAINAQPMRLYDSATGRVADFTTRFSFIIKPMTGSDNGADGLAFFLTPNGSRIPPDSTGYCLGLYSDDLKLDSSEKPVVAVEFDTFFYNAKWDPQEDHVGIDINSLRSVVTSSDLDLSNDAPVTVLVSYNSTTQNLSVYVTHDQPPVFDENPTLSYVFDLHSSLSAEWVDVGFSATTGLEYELHKIRSWEFDSTDFPKYPVQETESPAPSPAPFSDVFDFGPAQIVVPADQPPPVKKKTKNNAGVELAVGLVAAGITLLVVAVGMTFLLCVCCRKSSNEDAAMLEMPTIVENEQDHGMLLKRFLYDELATATSNFSEDRKLGEGGFGCVYKGILLTSDSEMEVAVKKVSKGSSQGKKEFDSEVTAISQLGHRNLVQLVGWCDKQGELLIVYEFMPNRSLDFHLFHGATMLTWALRRNIALGLASALLYLHEWWVKCILHRDIKSSNVMLDLDFNAKLGDFGLARLVDHEMGEKETRLAGTFGYMAPECSTTGKVGKESDVYSFGIVALEIACGRRVVERDKEYLVHWVLELYGAGRLLEAADAKLNNDFDDDQMERLMIVGLWCATYNYELRPTIKQAINVLNFEVPLPDLTFLILEPTHFRHSRKDFGISSTSSGTENQNQPFLSSHGSNSSRATTSTKTSTSSSLPRSTT